MACKEVDRVKAGLKLNSPGVRLCVVSFSKNRIDVPAAVQDAHNFDGRFRYLSFRIPAACPLDHILDINFLPAAASSERIPFSMSARRLRSFSTWASSSR